MSAGRIIRRRAAGEYFVSDDEGYRGDLGAAGAVELVGFAKSAFATPDAVGTAYGEWAIGAFAGPSVRLGDRGQDWSRTFGISARVPLTLGILCCAMGRGSDAGHVRSRPTRRPFGAGNDRSDPSHRHEARQARRICETPRSGRSRVRRIRE